MENKTLISVAPGDGVGPEITAATLQILRAAGARIEIQSVVMGAQAYAAGYKSGITPKAWDSIRRSRVLLKAPVSTPPDCRFRSPNVIIRKKLGLYANVRPCVSYYPFVQTRHPGMNVVIIRENEEDLYAGLEHRQSRDVTQCTRLLSHTGSEKILRYAFEYARTHFRKKVSCFTRDHVMKITDGLFHRVFRNIAREYPDLENEHWVVDVGAAHLAENPQQFDVIVTPNLYGDLLTDMTAQLAGSIGLAGSANLGETCAMFETVHGSAPARAGRDQANPSGLILAAVMMLRHIEQADIAEWVHNAWLRTLEDGQHTYDIQHGRTRQVLGTAAFAQAVIARLGQEPEVLSPVRYQNHSPITLPPPVHRPVIHKDLVGLDVFLVADTSPQELLNRLQALPQEHLQLVLLSNREIEVWPRRQSDICFSDQWRCRFFSRERRPVPHRLIVELLSQLYQAGLKWVKTEHLYDFEGQAGYQTV